MKSLGSANLKSLVATGHPTEPLQNITAKVVDIIVPLVLGPLHDAALVLTGYGPTDHNVNPRHMTR